jgi:hypothetical protein
MWAINERDIKNIKSEISDVLVSHPYFHVNSDINDKNLYFSCDLMTNSRMLYLTSECLNKLRTQFVPDFIKSKFRTLRYILDINLFYIESIDENASEAELQAKIDEVKARYACFDMDVSVFIDDDLYYTLVHLQDFLEYYADGFTFKGYTDEIKFYFDLYLCMTYIDGYLNPRYTLMESDKFDKFEKFTFNNWKLCLVGHLSGLFSDIATYL